MTNEEKEQWLEDNADHITENRTDNGPYSVLDRRFWRYHKTATTKAGTPRKYLIGKVRRMVPTTGEHGFDTDDIVDVRVKCSI